MEEVGSLDDCRLKVEQDVQRLWTVIDEAKRERQNGPLEIAMRELANLRHEVYENLNQIQHEFAILKAIEWCASKEVIASNPVWKWNPRATGDISEPDLVCFVDNEICISAEVTTSLLPQGVIDRRMAHTLSKLSSMAGRRFYFVMSAQMARRANTKVSRHGYEITVIDLSHDSKVPVCVL